MQKLRAFSLACSIPLAITPEALRQILEIFAREHIPDFGVLEGNEREKSKKGPLALASERRAA